MRRRLARVLTVASVLLIGTAVWFGTFPFYTDLRANARQEDLRKAFGTKSTKSDFAARASKDGDPLTRILIPALSVDTIVVEGTSQKALAAGAGHYPGTPLPGEAGNVAIAGHRTMNGKPFSELDKLNEGDTVTLITPFARYRYRVLPAFDGHRNPWVTSEKDWTVAAPTSDSMLTLTTCHPRGSSKQRLVARAILEVTENL